MKLYNEQYDSYYDPVNDVWLESKCSDPNCDYCSNRPERPSMKNFYVTDRDDYKLNVQVNPIKDSTRNHLIFTREFYDSEGNITDTSSVDFFMTEEEINVLKVCL